MGVHQSIGMKGIVLFGTDEQKERFLPDLASGPQARRLRADRARTPAPTPTTCESRAVQQPDGSWVLNGEKRYIGNGSKGGVFVTFARAEVDGKDRHIALILEKGMKGFEVGERYDTMGLRGNDLRRLYFNDVRVPAENVLGEPGEGFQIAMQILNNGRIGARHRLGRRGQAAARPGDRPRHASAASSAARWPTSSSSQEKIGWMVSYLFGLESMAYLTTAAWSTRASPDYSLESAICKVAGHRVPLVRGQPRAAARRRRGLHARPSPTRRSCATSASSRSSRAPTTCCARSSR